MNAGTSLKCQSYSSLFSKPCHIHSDKTMFVTSLAIQFVKIKMAPYCSLKSGRGKFQSHKVPWIFRKRMKIKLCIEYLSGHQIVLMHKVFHLLLWQQWRLKMAENCHLIQFISQTSSVTPIVFAFKRFF